MSKDKWNDELSAFLDGEAQDPDRIQRLLQEDPELAARHQQLAKLSEHLRTLPEPEVRPEFLTRVMAHVREQESVPKRPTWLQFGLPMLSLAMLALVIGLTTLNTETVIAPTEQAVVVIDEPGIEDAAAPLDLTDDEVVVARLAAMFEEGAVEADTAGGYYPEGEAEGEAVDDYDTAWTILEDDSWEAVYVGGYDEESDWYSEIDDFETDEWAVFDEVLNEYLSEDLS